jgi:hypothetical protein
VCSDTCGAPISSIYLTPGSAQKKKKFIGMILQESILPKAFLFYETKNIHCI